MADATTKAAPPVRGNSADPRVDYYYLFGPAGAAHIQFYRGWVEAARARGIAMELLCVLPASTDPVNRARIEGHAGLEYFRLLRVPVGRLAGPALKLFLLLRLLAGRRVVVQVHKSATQPLDHLKRLFGRRLQYVITMEGDYESEAEYLRAHPFRPGFYDREVRGAERQARAFPRVLRRCDHVFAVSDALRDLYVSRYTDIPQIEEKISILPTGVDCERQRFSEALRQEYRERLGVGDRFVVTYAGSIHHSWQNFARTAEAFQLLRQRCSQDFFFLLLIRRQDHDLAREFLARAGVAEENYHLVHAPAGELAGYLNAADLGVVLRHEHAVSLVAGFPGKLGDYAACGLPSLISRGVSGWAEVERSGCGAVLADMDDDEELIRKVSPLLHHDPERRRRIHEWARRTLSNDASADEYVRVLRMLAARQPLSKDAG